MAVITIVWVLAKYKSTLVLAKCESILAIKKKDFVAKMQKSFGKKYKNIFLLGLLVEYFSDGH